MYRISDENGNVIAQVEKPRYVRLKAESGAWIQCDVNSAECIAIDGVRYSLAGRDIVEDAPIVVYLQYIDAAAELYRAAKTADVNSNDIELLCYAVEKMAVEVDLSNYLTKTEAASTYVTKDNLQIILDTDTSTVEGAIWLEWS